MGFGTVLLGHRRARGLSQEELAAATGMSVRAISDLERGRTRQPRRHTLDVLATALSLTGSAREEFFAQPAAPPTEPGPVQTDRLTPVQLPRTSGDFLGRHQELDRLTDLLTELDGVPIGVVTGPGGIGKTALAVQVAHHTTPAFPDGQLFVTLRGTGGDPLRPVDVLGRLLRDLGADHRVIPAELDERAAAYRTLLAGRRVLVVLDDAADAAQVRPLLPGTPGSAALVTSRRTLADLEGGTPVSLGGLADPDARALYARLVGTARATDDPAATDTVLLACAGLPLAIRIAGAKLAVRPSWPVRWLAEQLSGNRSRLPALTAGDLAVLTTFQLGYDHLPHDTDVDPAWLFRLLAIPDGPSIGLIAAAVLADRPVAEVERALEILVDHHMVESPAPGRYRLHELVREFATTKLHAAEQRTAARRLLTWYLHTAHAAQLVLEPRRDPLPLPPALTGHKPLDFVDHEAGMRWYDAESANLVAAVAQADRLGEDTTAWQLSYTLASYFLLVEPIADWIGTHRIAVAAARRTGDQHAIGQTLDDLATAYYRALRFADAVTAYTEALAVARSLGSDVGAATVLNNLALAQRRLGRFDDAIEHHEQAVELANRMADPYGMCVANTNLGIAYAAVHRYDEALDRHNLALRLARRLTGSGRRFQTASVLRELGDVHNALGAHDRAVTCYTEADALATEIGAVRVRARSALGLAAAYQALGRPADRARAAATARELAGQLHDPELSDQAGLAGRVC